MNRCSRSWPVSSLTVATLSVVIACLFGATPAVWAAPMGGPADQLLPTPPPVTGSPTQPAAIATPTASPTPMASSQDQEGIVGPMSPDESQPFVPPVTFRTPVYGVGPTGSAAAKGALGDGYPADRHSERNDEPRLQDSFAKAFPVWCFWPIVGLILVVAGLDLRARSIRRLR